MVSCNSPVCVEFVNDFTYRRMRIREVRRRWHNIKFWRLKSNYNGCKLDFKLKKSFGLHVFIQKYFRVVGVKVVGVKLWGFFSIYWNWEISRNLGFIWNAIQRRIYHWNGSFLYNLGLGWRGSDITTGNHIAAADTTSPNVKQTW